MEFDHGDRCHSDGFLTCTRCGRSAPPDDFYANAKGRGGRHSFCRECHRAYAAAAHHRLRQTVHPRAESGTCSQCGETKPGEEFYRKSHVPSGITSACKRCTRISQAAQRYGIDRSVARALIDGVCALCGEADRVHIDHDHATGAVRGTLCRSCNIGIGHLRHSPSLLRRAADWLDVTATAS